MTYEILTGGKSVKLAFLVFEQERGFSKIKHELIGPVT